MFMAQLRGIVQPRGIERATQGSDAADLGGAWLLSFLCLALIRGQGDRLT